MDLIDRAEVLYKFAEILPEADSLDWYEQAKPDEVKELVDEMYSIVLNVDRKDAQYVKHGKWITEIKNDSTVYGQHSETKCSQCGYVIFTAARSFCPSCGAKMEGESDA